MTKLPADNEPKDLSSQDGGELLAHLRRLEKSLGPKPRANPLGDDDEGETTGNTPPSIRAPRDTVEARMRKRSGAV